jgi:hypothetical protein
VRRQLTDAADNRKLGGCNRALDHRLIVAGTAAPRCTELNNP